MRDKALAGDHRRSVSSKAAVPWKQPSTTWLSRRSRGRSWPRGASGHERP